MHAIYVVCTHRRTILQTGTTVSLNRQGTKNNQRIFLDLITVDMAGSDQMDTIMFVVHVYRMCTLSSDFVLSRAPPDVW